MEEELGGKMKLLPSENRFSEDSPLLGRPICLAPTYQTVRGGSMNTGGRLLEGPS
jgi:hypothetical protein